MQRGEQQLLLALRHKEEVVKLVSEDLAVLLVKESLTIRKDRIVDRETELLQVDKRMLLCKALVGVEQLSEEGNLQLLVHARLNHNNNHDQWLQSPLEQDLLPLTLAHQVLASLRTPNKAELVPLAPRFHMHLNGGRHCQHTGRG